MSIIDTQELQRKVRARPTETPEKPWNLKSCYFNLNSSSLWTEKEQNERMSKLLCVSI